MAKRQKLAAAELADFLEGAAASDSFAAELGLGEAADASAQGEPCHTTQATMDAAGLTEACAFLFGLDIGCRRFCILCRNAFRHIIPALC